MTQNTEDISYILTKKVSPYPFMLWNLHSRSIVAHKTGTSQTVNLMLSTIHLVIKSTK